MARTLNTKKDTSKPPSWFKKQRRQADRTRVKQALREDNENLPERRKNDQWDWS